MSPTMGIRICMNWILMPATETELVVRMPGGIPRGSLPKVNRTTFSSTMPRATVASSHAFEPRWTNGRTATRSTTAPHSADSASAAITARVSGHWKVTQKVKHRTAPSIMVEPCAKLTVFDTAWVTWNPSASSPYMLPSPKPEMSADVTNMRARYPNRGRWSAAPCHASYGFQVIRGLKVWPETRRCGLPSPRGAKRSGGEGSGGGGHFLPTAGPPHPGAFGADPPRRSQALAGGGYAAAPPHFEPGSEEVARPS